MNFKSGIWTLQSFLDQKERMIDWLFLIGYLIKLNIKLGGEESIFHNLLTTKYNQITSIFFKRNEIVKSNSISSSCRKA